MKRRRKARTTTKRKRTTTKRAAAPRRRRRRVARRNPTRRRRITRAHAAPRRRRRIRRNPSSSKGWGTVKTLFAIAAVSVPTILAAGILAPTIVPTSLAQKPVLYGGLMTAVGALAGWGLTAAGHPIIAAGVGLPLMILGGYTSTLGVMAQLAAPPPAAGSTSPNLGAIIARRRMGFVGLSPAATASASVGRGGMLPAAGRSSIAAVMTGRRMGAVYARGGMGAVYARGGMGCANMGAVEATVGDHRLRRARSLSSQLGI